MILRVFAVLGRAIVHGNAGRLNSRHRGIDFASPSHSPRRGKQGYVGSGRVGAESAPPIFQPTYTFVNSNFKRGALPSRVADNLFWLGRYTERVEANVRLLARAASRALGGREDFGRTVTLETALNILVGLHYLPADDPQGVARRAALARVQRFPSDMVYDPSRISSLGWNLKEMRRVAWQLKERMSNDTWRVLLHLESEFSRPVPINPEHRFLAQIAVLDRAVTALSAFSGLLMENTTRGEGWRRFLEIGLRVSSGHFKSPK